MEIKLSIKSILPSFFSLIRFKNSLVLEYMCDQKSTLVNLLCRILSPKVQKMKGIGMKATAMKPRSDVPQPKPSELYMLLPASGSTAPKSDRKTVDEAVTEAA